MKDEAVANATQAEDNIPGLLADLPLGKPSEDDNLPEPTPTEPEVTQEVKEPVVIEEDKSTIPPEAKEQKVEVTPPETNIPEEKIVEEVKAPEEDKPDTIPKKNYDELRSFSDRKIFKLTEAKRKLEEELRAKVEPVESKEYGELSKNNSKLLQDNKTLSATLAKIQKEYDINLADYSEKVVPKPLTASDINSILDAREKKQVVPEKDNSEMDEVKADIMDYMSKKGFLERDGSIGERGKKFTSILDGLNLPNKSSSELYEKLIQANDQMTGQPVIKEKVKEAVATTMAALGGSNPTSTPTPKVEAGPLDGLLAMNKFYN